MLEELSRDQKWDTVQLVGQPREELVEDLIEICEQDGTKRLPPVLHIPAPFKQKGGKRSRRQMETDTRINRMRRFAVTDRIRLRHHVEDGYVVSCLAAYEGKHVVRYYEWVEAYDFSAEYDEYDTYVMALKECCSPIPEPFCTQLRAREGDEEFKADALLVRPIGKSTEVHFNSLVEENATGSVGHAIALAILWSPEDFVGSNDPCFYLDYRRPLHSFDNPGRWSLPSSRIHYRDVIQYLQTSADKDGEEQRKRFGTKPSDKIYDSVEKKYKKLNQWLAKDPLPLELFKLAMVNDLDRTCNLTVEPERLVHVELDADFAHFDGVSDTKGKRFYPRLFAVEIDAAEVEQLPSDEKRFRPWRLATFKEQTQFEDLNGFLANSVRRDEHETFGKILASLDSDFLTA